MPEPTTEAPPSDPEAAGLHILGADKGGAMSANKRHWYFRWWAIVGWVLLALVTSALLALGLGACGTSSSPGQGATPSSQEAPVANPSSTPITARTLTAQLAAAGLPIGKIVVYTATSDPNALLGRQGGYTSKTAWADERALAAEAHFNDWSMAQERVTYGIAKGPSAIAAAARAEGFTVAWEKSILAIQQDTLGPDQGGGIEVYPTSAGASARAAYLSNSPPLIGDGYDDVVGIAVLRLSRYFTPTQAHVYERAFEAAAHAAE